ncbi:MAG: SDR family oxidoreductase [Bryobacter sp.]|nr:SDR family oxidoreductase [Bryobacter sp.]
MPDLAALDFTGQYFTGKHVAITGGTSGIGLALAEAFLGAGATVLAGGLETGLDVRSEASLAAWLSSLPHLDVLVNAAGVIRRGEEHLPEVFAEVVDINLNGAMRACQAAKPLLLKSLLGQSSAPAVVNIASMLSFFGSGPAPAYSASKGGLAQLTKSLALSWAPLGIRVNAVAPGWIETPLTAPLREDAAKHEALRARTPMGRWGKPADVTGPVLFLASPLAAFVTGAILPVDGGYLIA